MADRADPRHHLRTWSCVGLRTGVERDAMIAATAKMLDEALGDRNMTFDAKAAIVRDWIARDATDQQAEMLGNQIGRIPSERIRG